MAEKHSRSQFVSKCQTRLGFISHILHTDLDTHDNSIRQETRSIRRRLFQFIVSCCVSSAVFLCIQLSLFRWACERWRLFPWMTIFFNYFKPILYLPCGTGCFILNVHLFMLLCYRILFILIFWHLLGWKKICFNGLTSR